MSDVNRCFDLIVRNGRWFDGRGSPSAIRHIGVRGGRVAAVSETPLNDASCPEVLDATGRWVMPGFLDVHTHQASAVRPPAAVAALKALRASA